MDKSFLRGLTTDARLFERGQRVRIRVGVCKRARFDLTGQTAILGRALGLGRFQITLEETGKVINVEGRFLEFLS